jgi:DNA-binding CsgD family transcriptional regulator
MQVLNMSGRVKLSDVRRMCRLIAGCADRWADANAWRQHLLKGMRELFDAQVAMCVEGGGVDGQARPYHVEMATAGWPSPAARRRFIDYLDMGGPAMMPDFGMIARRIGRRGFYTGRRRDHVPDVQWYGSDAYLSHFVPIGFDDYVVSMHAMPDLGTTSSLSVHRMVDAPAFEPRHRRLLGLLHGELAPRIGHTLALRRQRGLHGLTRRQRQTLCLLMEGDSEKHLAHRLGLSPTTVHGYVRELYAYFHVTSRGQLLSYFLNRKPRPTAQQVRIATAAG